MVLKNRISAFTLMELSIVIVIVALIVGGILTGRSLIRNSELLSIVSESEKYTRAIGTFRDKYNALPGDFAGATAIWGAADASATTCKTTIADNAIATCDGDGNGRILNNDDIANTYYEQFRAWHHLSNAGIIDGSYSGISTSGYYSYTIGVNIPKSDYNSAGWKLLTVTTRDISNGDISGITYQSGDIPPNVVLWWGGAYYEASQRMTPLINANEAYVIDSKIDDGLGGLGKLITQNDGVNDCYDTISLAYNPASDEVNCALIFKTGY